MGMQVIPQLAPVAMLTPYTIAEFLKRVQTSLSGLTRFEERTTAKSLLETDYYMVGDTTGGNITFTLPKANSCRNKQYYVKKKVAGNTLTVAANSADNIEGAASVAFTTQYDGSGFISDGVNRWYRF